MRRRIVLITMLLIGGAIVNVAVAWGTMLWISTYPGSSEIRRVNESLQRWTITVTEYGFGKSLITRTTTTYTGEEEFVRSDVLEVCAGWPLRAFKSSGPGGKQVHRDGGVMNYSPTTGWRGGFPIDSGPLVRPAFAVLPYMPTWPGFAINTIFYAAILWLLFFVPGSVRRAFRRRRGLCPACAYPVGTSPVCTECGKPVTNQKAEAQKAEIT